MRSTPIGVYRELIRMHRKEALDGARGKSGLFLKKMAEQNFGVYRSVR